MENEFYEEPNSILAYAKADALAAEMDEYRRQDAANTEKLKIAAANMMNIISNDFGHSGLELDCPLCSAYVESARLHAFLNDAEMPFEVLQWDKRKS